MTLTHYFSQYKGGNMVISFYLMTNRLRDIIERNKDLSFEELGAIENRFHVVLYLAGVYKRDSLVPMTAMDYKNIYNIFYIICLPDFGKSLQPQRVGLAKKYVQQVKSGQAVLSELIDDLFFTSHIS